MAVQRTARPRGSVSWPLRVSRQHLAGALQYAMHKARASQPAAARWCGKSERTVRNWLNRAVAIDVEAVLSSSKLRREFLRYLSVCDRKGSA